MLPALCVIALSVLFRGGPVRLCRIFVKFSGFVVIGVCHVGSISAAPSAQQPAGLRAVPRSHGMVCEGLQNVPSNLNTVPRCKGDCSKARLSDDGQLACFKLTVRLCWMHRFRMVIVQVRSQVVSNYYVPSHGHFEKSLLHVAREVRPQCEHGSPQQAFKFVS